MTTENPRQHPVTPKDLPLCCPLPEMALWNTHPRVYLTFDAQGHAICPYCSTEYTLTDQA